MSRAFRFFAVQSAEVIAPETLLAVLAISIIGSMAKIKLSMTKLLPNPIPANIIEAAIVALPGTPAIPKDPITATKTIIKANVKSICVCVAKATKTAAKAGKYPAQPLSPVVVPIDATKLAIAELTPNLFCKVEVVIGKVPKEDLELNANNHTGKAFFAYFIGFKPL